MVLHLQCYKESSQKALKDCTACFISLNLEEHYAAQASSSSAVPAEGGRLYLDAYEVSFPLEESMDRPQSYHLNQGQQMMEGTPSYGLVENIQVCSCIHLWGGAMLAPPVNKNTRREYLWCVCEGDIWPVIPEPVVQEPPHSQYSPFILVSNLRAHLYVALEKNAWLQKRIEELEEERNFLRCQLDRFIVSMRSSEGEDAHLLQSHSVCDNQ